LNEAREKKELRVKSLVRRSEREKKIGDTVQWREERRNGRSSIADDQCTKFRQNVGLISEIQFGQQCHKIMRYIVLLLEFY